MHMNFFLREFGDSVKTEMLHVSAKACINLLTITVIYISFKHAAASFYVFV